ncbi:MAG: COG4315 family predicted lipoprotein [Geminicoccaceae bacterium]
MCSGAARRALRNRATLGAVSRTIGASRVLDGVRTLVDARRIGMTSTVAKIAAAAAVAALPLAWIPTGAAAEAGKAATVQVSKKEPYGKYLTDAEGMSVYLFEADGKLSSACASACAQAWPPLLSDGQPTAGEGVEKSLLSTFKRDDGSTQIAYDGRPLYQFAKDAQPGDTKGQDVEGFGAEWYLISPEGEKVEAEK